MPSPNYNENQSVDNQNATPRMEKFRQIRNRYDSGTAKAPDKYFGSKGTPKYLALVDKEKEKFQKEMKNKLSRIQRTAPKTAIVITKDNKRTIAGFVFNLLAQIDLTTDWLFMILFSFGLLKDIFDIVFAAMTAIPPVGIAGTAIGIVVSFVGDLLFLILVVTILILVGSNFKNRGMAKYFLGIAMEFIAEALPGISWLPWTVVYVFILYLCVLSDRAYSRQQTEPVAQIQNKDASSVEATEVVPEVT